MSAPILGLPEIGTFKCESRQHSAASLPAKAGNPVLPEVADGQGGHNIEHSNPSWDGLFPSISNP
jgi:hypothetical protein